MSLAVKIGNMILQNPILGASGTFGYGLEFEDYVDLNKIVVFVQKEFQLILEEAIHHQEL